MRWGYLLPRFIIAGLVWAFFAYWCDPLIRRAAVSAGQSVADAKVEIDDLETKFFPPRLTLHGVQVANRKNPWKNLFQFDELHFALAVKPLLRQSLIIEDATLTGLQWNTPRTTSGELPARERSSPSPYAKLVRTKAKELAIDWFDDFAKRMKLQVDPRQLASVQLAGQLKANWTKRFDAYEQRVKSFETRIQQIEATTKNARGNTLQKIAAYRKAAVQAQQLLAEADRMRKELEQLPKTASGDFRRIDAARQTDQLSVQSKLKTITHPNAESISNTLLGPTLKARLDEAVEWARWTKDGLAKLTAGGPKPKRLRGMTIPFKREAKFPRFLLRKLHIAGVADWKGDPMPFAGTMTDVTSDPKRHGKPVVVRLHGKAKAELKLVAVVDDTNEVPKRRLRLVFADPRPRTMSLGDKKKMKLSVSAGRTDWSADVSLVGEQLSGVVQFRQSPVKILASTTAVKQSSNIARFDFDPQRMLETALGSVNRLQAKVVLSGNVKRPKWELQSDLGQQVAAGVQTMMQRELVLKERQMVRMLNAAVQKQTGELTNHLNASYKKLLSKLNLQERGAQQIIQRLAGGQLPVDAFRGRLDTKRLPLNKLPVKFPINKLPVNKLPRLPKKIDFKSLFN